MEGTAQITHTSVVRPVVSWLTRRQGWRVSLMQVLRRVRGLNTDAEAEPEYQDIVEVRVGLCLQA